jgi:hypothetical protein
VSVPVATVFFVAAVPPLVLGLWQLLAPSHEVTLDPDSLRARVETGSL